MLLTPLLVLWAAGTILELGTGILAKIGLFFLLSVSLNATVLVAYDETLGMWSPPGLYLGGMACMYHAWLTTIRPLVSPLHTAAIILLSLLVSSTSSAASVHSSLPSSVLCPPVLSRCCGCTSGPGGPTPAPCQRPGIALLCAPQAWSQGCMLCVLAREERARAVVETMEAEGGLPQVPWPAFNRLWISRDYPLYAVALLRLSTPL
jgi:hypothetical protein